jgi:hypothetical protein
MSKLYQALNWFTLDQAADRLSVTLSGKVTRKEVLQFIVDEKIDLYWYVNFKFGGVTPEVLKKFEDEGKWKLKDISDLKGGLYRIDLRLNPFIKSRLISELLSQPRNSFENGSFLTVEDDCGCKWHVLEFKQTQCFDGDPEGYNEISFPILREPEYEALVLKKKDLEEFEDSLVPEIIRSKSSETKERESLYKILIAMARDAYDFDPAAKRNTSTKKILESLDKYRMSLDEGTVRNWLKQACKTVLFIDIQDN